MFPSHMNLSFRAPALGLKSLTTWLEGRWGCRPTNRFQSVVLAWKQQCCIPRPDPIWNSSVSFEPRLLVWQLEYSAKQCHNILETANNASIRRGSLEADACVWFCRRIFKGAFSRCTWETPAWNFLENQGFVDGQVVRDPCLRFCKNPQNHISSHKFKILQSRSNTFQAKECWPNMFCKHAARFLHNSFLWVIYTNRCC